VAGFGGLLLVHAEDPAAITEPAPDSLCYRDFLRSRPDEAEVSAVRSVVRAAAHAGCRVHVVHLSSAAALPLVEDARRDAVAVTVETCPHYLTFAAEDVPDGATEYKCCPPIRDEANREALWDGLARGAIDAVVSDHSPCPPELKHRDTGRFADAWGGISSLQIGLSAVWTEAHRRGHTLVDVVRWMASAPAESAGLAGKGRIAVGADADFCVFSPDATYAVRADALEHRHKLTPYAGRELRGRVVETWLAGARVEFGEPPRGRLLGRPAPTPERTPQGETRA
jgi:allantoinase